MKNFFISTSLVIFAVAVGWYYLPNDAKEKAAAFVGIAARRDTGEIKNFIAEVVLPQDPKEKRKILLGELGKNITEIKRRVSGEKQGAGASDQRYTKVSFPDLIGASEKIIKELGGANDDKSVGREITDRILDAVLPAKREPAECRSN